MMTQPNEQMLEKRLEELKQQLPELVSEDVVIAEPSVEQPFAIPPRQRMDPIDITIEQVLCAEKALANKKATEEEKKKKQVKRAGQSTRRNSEGIKMKRIAKQIGNKLMCYTQNEKDTFILNEGNPVKCIVTCYDSLAVFNIPKEDVRCMNRKMEEMVYNAGFSGTIQKWGEVECTLFLKSDKYTQYFNAKAEKLNELPKKVTLMAKVCMRFMGILKVDGEIKPMVRLYQVKVEEEDGGRDAGMEPCMFN